MDYRIEQVKVDDASLREIQSLLQTVFLERACKFSFEYLKWQYADNPAGPVVGFNAYWGDDLVAHYATMPVYMNIGGEKTLGVLSLNTATHPDHRGKRLFTILAEKTFEYAADSGYKFVVGVANANSTPGFVKHLGFNLVCPLDFKIGIGTGIYPLKEYAYIRYWDEDLLSWRIKNPSMDYFKNGDMLVGPIKPGFKKLVYHDGAGNLSLKKLHWHPFNLYIGLGANLKNGLYCGVPRFVKHSPFNVVFRDLTNGSLPVMTKDNVLFELIDFDVA